MPVRIPLFSDQIGQIANSPQTSFSVRKQNKNKAYQLRYVSNIPFPI